MRQATKLEGHYKVIAQYLFEGHWNITVEIEGDGWKMPKVLSFDGKIFGFTGWNSDRNHAYYNTGVELARGI